MPANNTLTNQAKKINESAREFAGRDIRDKRRILLEAFYSKVKVPERLDLDDWMDQNYYLPAEASSEHGRWRTSRFPFLRKPAKKLSPSSKAGEIGICKGAQLGFTTLTNGWKFYIADHVPGPTLFIQPTIDSVKEYSEQKFEPAIEACPKVKPILGKDRPKNFTNTKLRKYFPGGFISLAGGNSPNSVASKSVRNLIVDEEARFPTDLKSEGSTIHLAIRRTANFPDSKIYRNSTPTIAETDSIETYCKTGTQEHYLVPCPECNDKADPNETFFEIKWELMNYENDDPSTIRLACPCCGALIPEHRKTWMLDNAFWYRYNPTPRKEFRNDERRQDLLIKLSKHGYHDLTTEDRAYIDRTSLDDDDELRCTFFISSLYSPLGFFSWQEACDLWLEANRKRDKGLLKVFVNTVLGETFRATSENVEHSVLARRKESYDPYGEYDVPSDCLVVTMGVDVQKDRLECQIVGYGLDNEKFVLDYKVFYGDTEFVGDYYYKYKDSLTCWGQLHEYLGTSFHHPSGHRLPIECTLIDSRYRSPKVYEFCKRNYNKRVFAVQGHEGWGKGNIERSKKPNKYGVYVFKAFTDELKFSNYSQYEVATPGPGYIHFNVLVDYPSHYFKGLVIEELKVKRVNGNDVQYWENPPGGRNEAIDTLCYADTAFYALKLNLYARQQALSLPPDSGEKPKKKIIRRR